MIAPMKYYTNMMKFMTADKERYADCFNMNMPGSMEISDGDTINFYFPIENRHEL